MFSKPTLKSLVCVAPLVAASAAVVYAHAADSAPARAATFDAASPRAAAPAPLDPQSKVRLYSAVAKVVAVNLGTGLTFTTRRPYNSPTSYLDFDNADVSTRDGVARLDRETSKPRGRAILKFPVEANTLYVADCAVRVNDATNGSIRTIMHNDSWGGSSEPKGTVPVVNGHAIISVPKATAAGATALGIEANEAADRVDWYSCEILPVKP